MSSAPSIASIIDGGVEDVTPLALPVQDDNSHQDTFPDITWVPISYLSSNVIKVIIFFLYGFITG